MQPAEDTLKLWTIDELGQAVATSLALAQVGQGNGQVREVPNKRTIRYYTTLGLLDRPAQMRGRTAFYGPRHLRQLVAIKRLQAQGLPLKEIQAELTGIPSEALGVLADLPEGALEGGVVASTMPLDEGPSRRDAEFWGSAPVDEPEEPLVIEQPALGTADPSAPEAVQLNLPGVLPAVELHDAATLILRRARELDDDDLEAIRLASAPLLDVLKQRGLLGDADAPDSTQGGTR